MQTYRLGTSDLNVTRIGYGCMMIGGSWDDTPLTDSIRNAAMEGKVLRHRALLNYDGQAEGIQVGALVRKAVETLPEQAA